jgi:hypothetical protein
MDQKNLMAQVARFVKRTTTGELPDPELALLSEEDLQQIVGGFGEVTGTNFGLGQGTSLQMADERARDLEREKLVKRTDFNSSRSNKDKRA